MLSEAAGRACTLCFINSLCSTLHLRVLYVSFTWNYRFDTDPRGIPVALEAKVPATVGLLVQADPHLTVVHLEDTDRPVLHRK